MPRGTLPEYRKRLEPILDHYLQMAIDSVGGKHDESGKYATLLYTGCESRDRANEIRKALYRSAYHLKVSLSYKIHNRADGTYDVEFTVYEKKHATAYHINAHGSDPSKWAYHPRKKLSK
jgi:hypothetical protein